MQVGVKRKREWEILVLWQMRWLLNRVSFQPVSLLCAACTNSTNNLWFPEHSGNIILLLTGTFCEGLLGCQEGLFNINITLL